MLERVIDKYQGDELVTKLSECSCVGRALAYLLQAHPETVHHYQFVLDNLVKELTGKNYKKFVATYERNGDIWKTGEPLECLAKSS